MRHAISIALAAAVCCSPAAAQDLNSYDRAARDIFKELIEINTTDSSGSTTKAAEAMAARLKAAGFSDADLHVLGPNSRKGNLVARLRGRGQIVAAFPQEDVNVAVELVGFGLILIALAADRLDIAADGRHGIRQVREIVFDFPYVLLDDRDRVLFEGLIYQPMQVGRDQRVDLVEQGCHKYPPESR
jgi:hypothetical protein